MSRRVVTKRSGISQRIKNIMCLANLENQPLDSQNTNRRKTGRTGIRKKSHLEKYSSSAGMKHQKLAKETHSFVNSLYVRDYSMTSEFFQYFCETQNTATSHHFNNICNIIHTLKGSCLTHVSQPLMTEAQQEADLFCAEAPIDSLTLDTQPAETEIQQETAILFCAESMPIDSLTLDTQPVEREIQQETAILFCAESMPIDSPSLDTQPDEGESQHEMRILFCKETVPIDSPVQDSNKGDYDSDDSVKDKDYEPIEDDQRSDDTDEDTVTEKPKTARKRSKKINVSKFIARKTKPLRRHSMEIMTSNSLPLRKRRMTIDANLCVAVSTYNASEQATQETNNLPPKRKKHSTSLKQRKLEKQFQKQCQYKIKNGCDNKCLKKCSSIFTTDEREQVHRKYWNMTRSEMRVFLRSNYTVAIPKRKYTTEPKRNPKRCFSLPKTDGTLASVCKTFFLTTLGFKKTNDKILSRCLDDSNDIAKRGKHNKTPKFDREVITKHVESFNPSAPHYRREHAPNRRYLPSEINVNFMYKDFCTKHPDVKIGYEMYRTHLKSMNISFARLGNEECELCESYTLHTRDTNHDARKEIISNCIACEEWAVHHEKYTNARQLYESHKSIEQNEDQVYYSSDLEKVIMLPRLETFKAVIFCPRLTAFNQTFAPVGKITKDSKPLAAIWHDGIAGRKQEDIMSAYYNFFLRFRDVKIIHIWMDNCTAQNKNWLLFSMLADLVNSEVIATERIILYYFEPGHTFMSCDQFHHQVELSMKKKSKIYDFTDFEDAVASANNGKVILKSMQPQDFINYPNNVSERRIQNANPRAYLRNMSEVCFTRSSFDLQYKNNFAEDYITLKFLNDKFLKNPQLSITFRAHPKGIEKERKLNIIKTLSPIIPKHKMFFWQNLPIIRDDNEHHQRTSHKRVTK